MVLNTVCKELSRGLKMNKEITQQSSIEVTKNSKGITYKVKAYAETTIEIEAKLNELLKIAQLKESQLL